MSTLESHIEAKFARKVRLIGGYSIKLAPTEAGIPDRLVIFPGPLLHLVELKAEHGRLSPVQQAWHTRMHERYNLPVSTLYGEAGVLDWLRQKRVTGFR